MELYKAHNINPFSSCLPLLIQLPILIALYRVFMQSLNGQELHGIYSFIQRPETISPMFLGFIDLAAKNIPMAALAAILQFLQGRMQQPNVKSSDATQQMIAQQTMYVFPLMTLILGATVLPAGLTLYWIVTTLFGIGQQYYIIRKEAKEALNAAK
jgi:YidC/Oxa1 family membrane protein insertase